MHLLLTKMKKIINNMQLKHIKNHAQLVYQDDQILSLLSNQVYHLINIFKTIPSLQLIPRTVNFRVRYQIDFKIKQQIMEFYDQI